MAADPTKLPEKLKRTAEGLNSTKAALSKMKGKMPIIQKVSEQLREAAAEFKAGDKKEALKKMTGIFSLAALSYILPKKKKEQEKDEEGVTVTEADNGETEETEEGETVTEEATQKVTEYDPALTERVSSVTPKCTKTKDVSAILADHHFNARIIELLPSRKAALNQFMEKYRENKARYKKVSEAVHIPAMLIAAIHYMEGGMNFETYLHNGQRLGTMTTFVPRDILFDAGQWEEAAIHALGGNIKDKNGKPSRQDFQVLRKQLGMTEKTIDIGMMLTFAERYNGLGYRNHGRQSSYVYAGTNVMTRGKYIADGIFDPGVTSARVGVASMLMAIQSEAAGIPMKIAASDKLLVDHGAGQNEALIAKRKAENKPTPKGTKPTKHENLSPAVRLAAQEARVEARGKPIGAEIRRTIEGKTYVFQKQWHFNHPGKAPNGNHGIGAFEVV